MAIVVEDGTGLSNSNSYVSEAELSAYCDNRGITLSGDPEQLLFKAMDYLEQQRFQGVKNTKDQALQWPRYGVSIDGYDIGTDEIPNLLKESLYEIVILLSDGGNPLGNDERLPIYEKIGEIEVRYYETESSSLYNQSINNKLRKLVSGSFGVTARVIRA